MTIHSRYLKCSLGICLTMNLCGPVVLTCSAAQKSSGSITLTNLVPAIPSAEIPQSIFVIPATPKEGRNPFFPQSAVAIPVARTTTPAPIDTSVFILNGITSPPRRTAMINGATFEPGEEHEIKLPDGTKRLIKCEEIKADSAIINVNGVRRELKLRFGL